MDEKHKLFHEEYHSNCHDYLKKYYLDLYAAPVYKQMLLNIKKKIPIVNICAIIQKNYEKVIVCDQHAFIVTHYNDKYPIIATYALNACVGLLMYVKDYGVCSLAHIDGLPGYSIKSATNDNIKIDYDPVRKNILNILKKMRQMCQTNNIIKVEYYLVGGIFGLSEIMVHDIIECINDINERNNYIITFVGRNIMGPENQSRNVCIDSRTGEISYFDFILNTENYNTRRNDRGLPINIIKAPYKSKGLLDLTYCADIIQI